MEARASDPGLAVGPTSRRSLPGDHEAVVAPPPGHPRFPLIDSVRGLAALFIVVAHGVALSGILPTAWYHGLFAHNLGLATFFVVSGFVVYRPFVANRVLGARPPGILAYARRRFVRIIPPYWMALTVLAIYPGLVGVFTGNWWVYYGLMQLYPVYDATACTHAALGCGIAVAVTLPAELTLYVIFPLVAALMARLVSTRLGVRWLHTELVLIAVLACASIAVRAGTVASPPFRPYLFYGITGTFLWGGLGMAMASISVASEERRNQGRSGIGRVKIRAWACWLSAAAIYVALSAAYPEPLLPPGGPPRPDLLPPVVEFVALGTAAALVMLPAVFGDGGLIRSRVLANPVLGWLGIISYGLYLYHLPIQLKLKESGIFDLMPRRPYVPLLAASLAVTVACAATSYYAFERPILRFKEPRRRRRALAATDRG